MGWGGERGAQKKRGGREDQGSGRSVTVQPATPQAVLTPNPEGFVHLRPRARALAGGSRKLWAWFGLSLALGTRPAQPALLTRFSSPFLLCKQFCYFGILKPYISEELNSGDCISISFLARLSPLT